MQMDTIFFNMSFHFAQPSEPLKPFVKQYWAIENVLQKGEQYTQRVIPSGLTELILYLGYKPKAFTKNRLLEEPFLLNGQQNDYYDILISENLSLFSISFHPQGLSQFFPIPIYELSNHDIPLKYINKDLYSELEARLSVEITFQEKVEIVEKCLLKLLINNKREYEFKRINHIIEMIKVSKGDIKINELSNLACLSRKQFERTFMDYIGISPKQYLKIIRLQSSIFLKSKNRDLTLTELAYESGYYDQSHFINDYRAMTGITPKQFFNDCDNIHSDFFE